MIIQCRDTEQKSNYGAGFSVFTNIIARGGEVEFANNSEVDIKFGARPDPPKPAGHFVAGAP